MFEDQRVSHANRRTSRVYKGSSLLLESFYDELPPYAKLVIAGGNADMRALTVTGCINSLPPLPVIVLTREGSRLSCYMERLLMDDLDLREVGPDLPYCYLYGLRRSSVKTLFQHICRNRSAGADQYADAFLKCAASRNPLSVPAMYAMAMEMDNSRLREYAKWIRLSDYEADRFANTESNSPSDEIRAAVSTMADLPYCGCPGQSILQFLCDFYCSDPPRGGVLVLPESVDKPETLHHVLSAELNEAASYHLPFCLILDNINMEKTENDPLYKEVQELSGSGHISLVVSTAIGENVPGGIKSLGGFGSHLIFCSEENGTSESFQEALDVFSEYDHKDVQRDLVSLWRRVSIGEHPAPKEAVRRRNAVTVTDCYGYEVVARANPMSWIQLCRQVVFPRNIRFIDQ